MVGDNGASAEGSPDGLLNEMTFFNNIQVPFEDTYARMNKLGDPINDWTWERYQVAEDFSQSNDVAEKHPEKLKELQYLFYGEARKYNVLPIDNKKVKRMDIRNRPSLTLGREKFTYYDAMTRIPEGTAPDFKNKSYSITAEVEIGSGHNDGMLVTQGGRFGGWGLYIHEGRPKYVYNLANLERTFIVGEPLSPGKHTIRYEFDYDDDHQGFGGGGDGTLYVDGKKVATGRVPRTMGIRISLDETFDIGADAGEPVSEDYHVPFDFAGTLNKIDVPLGDAALSNRSEKEGRLPSISGGSRRRSLSNLEINKKPTNRRKIMKNHFSKLGAVLFVALVMPLTMLAVSAQAQETTSPLMKKLYNGNWPSEEEANKLVDELYYQRAVHAYMTMLPAINVIGMRDGSEAEFGKGYNVLPIWKDRMDSRTWVPTPNADVIYSMSYLDLKETGPLVVAAPPRVIGMFTDFFQRTLTDVGPGGPDKGRGGLYLLLPPGYEGHIPDGYHVFKSSTYNVFLFFRTIMEQGENGPNPKPAVKTAEKTSIYPLWDEEKNIKPMQFPNASGKNIDMMYPVDSSYWTKLKKFVDYEPVTAITPELRGVLASIGIIKGKPFNPTVRQQKILDKAVDIAPRMILAKRMLGRADKRHLYYHDRQYERIWAGGTAEWMQESYLDVDQRSAFFQFGYSSAPAMVMRAIDNGSKYPVTPRDKDGKLLSGEHTYKMHLPAGIPAILFWAVTAYNVTDGTMTATDQLMPSRNGFEKTVKNADGSIDIYFGPKQPEGVADTNFIKTVPGRNFLAALRLFGTSNEFFDQTWKPDDLVKLK